MVLITWSVGGFEGHALAPDPAELRCGQERLCVQGRQGAALGEDAQAAAIGGEEQMADGLALKDAIGKALDEGGYDG